ncbi:MAG: universal stress protein [Armatimonadetes bacterium]|nr:universal stress protein [Armatimonadota bacterium]
MKIFLVAIDSSPVADDIMHLACKLAKIEKAKLYIVYVFEVPRSLPLDAEIPEEFEKGDLILDKAANIAEEAELPFETDLIQARSSGPGIVDEAKDLGAELIIIGMTTKSRFGELIFGSTVSYVLQKAPCRVIVIKK